MGANTSPDIFQQIKNEILGDIPNIQVYLDDILITSSCSFEEKLDILKTIVEHLQKAILEKTKQTIWDMEYHVMAFSHNLRM
jgi:hypothetical protein